MLGAINYKTKKQLKQSIGKSLTYIETSCFGNEYQSNGTFNIVGPNAYNNRKWYATVTMKNDKIIKVT
jgi:hypothetical protein